MERLLPRSMGVSGDGALEPQRLGAESGQKLLIVRVRSWPKADVQNSGLNVRLRPKAVVRLTAGMVTNTRYPITAIPG